MAQFIRPSSNITQTNFTGGFADIDETSASDTDFAYSANNTTAVLQVLLSAPSTPLQAGTTTVRYRIARTNGATVDGTGSNSTVSLQIRQGASIIATDATQNTTGTWTTITWTPDLTAITNWSDVRLYFTVVGGGGSPANRRGAGISWAEIETPDQLLVSTGDGSSTSTSTATGDAEYDANYDGSSTSTSSTDGVLAATSNQTGDTTSISTASGDIAGLFVSVGDSSSVSIATGDAVWYFASVGDSSSVSIATGEFTGLVITSGSSTSTSISTGAGWDGIVRTPGDLINDIETNGWLSNSTSLNDAIDEEVTEDDSDVIWSPSYVGAPQSTLFDIEPISAGVEYRCKIRARTSNSTAANIKLMFYNDTTFVTETSQQSLSQTLTTYEFLVTPISVVNRVRIYVSAA